MYTPLDEAIIHEHTSYLAHVLALGHLSADDNDTRDIIIIMTHTTRIGEFKLDLEKLGLRGEAHYDKFSSLPPSI